jgi:ABC-type antimicrobial peptide transport system permease subunit
MAAGALGLLALALAAAGLYAVMSYSVALRRREIGVRMAVGARPVDILRMVLGQSVRVVAAGIVVGVVLVVPLTHAVRFLFVGVSPLDPTALIAPLLLLIATALVAGALPARRAARVDPARALRQD